MEIPQELWRKNYEESQILTSDNLAAAKRNGKWGFVNQMAKKYARLKYDATFPFINGTAAVKNRRPLGRAQHCWQRNSFLCTTTKFLLFLKDLSK